MVKMKIAATGDQPMAANDLVEKSGEFLAQRIESSNFLA